MLVTAVFAGEEKTVQKRGLGLNLGLGYESLEGLSSYPSYPSYAQHAPIFKTQVITKTVPVRIKTSF